MVQFDEIIVGESYWTMRGNLPVRLEVIKKWSCKHMGGWDCYYINCWDEHKKTVHDRKPDRLFKTRDDLQAAIFPKIIKPDEL